jgi:excisionase family DNA binding protein
VIDINNPYALLDLWFPGQFRGQDRFQSDKPQPTDGNLNLKEASEYLGISERRLKDLCRERRISHGRVDYRTYRFTRADLNAYLNAFRVHRKGLYD